MCDRDDGSSKMISRRKSPIKYVIDSADELRARVQGAIEHKAAKIAEARSALEKAQRSLIARQAVLAELERAIRVGAIVHPVTEQESSAAAEVNELLGKVRSEAQVDLTMAEEDVKACQAALVDLEKRLPIDFLFHREIEIADAERQAQQATNEVAEKGRHAAHDLAVKRVCDTLIRELVVEDQALSQRLEKSLFASMFCFLGLTGLLIIPLLLWVEGRLHEWRIVASLWGVVESALVLYWIGLRFAAHRQLQSLWRSIDLLNSAGFVVYRAYGIFGSIKHLSSSLIKVDISLPDPTQEHCYVQFAGVPPPTLGNFGRAGCQHFQPMILTAKGLELLVSPSSKKTNQQG